ncbi:hypothetical protein COV04_00030 [Candidatus Uhrbacteria bacterium CG10_big_fil_rev_8_21_14_0_10_48_11]|uniref:DUF4129 domain-containing protein n=1 Tax=Candidatus Uhrbacteria bacterium CG10_big_fil_rev_8_21_14_0_10_48_11 TaxID=1975037 RepID=A0A2M8LFP8_9BACT|nr:MAG: hypothetical protein COV04_00030 [Candidatus Uhrbacteria bacterium CG10_big_fil_rev_8_21_14_0_10_48_11]
MLWFLVVILLFALAIIFWLLKQALQHRDRARDFRFEDRQAWQKKWQELETLLGQGEASWSVAVIEADKLFDRVLKHMRLPGKDMGERLKYLTRSRTELCYVWPAHLTRNRLVHESDFKLNRRLAAQTIDTFRRALHDLGVL